MVFASAYRNGSVTVVIETIGNAVTQKALHLETQWCSVFARCLTYRSLSESYALVVAHSNTHPPLPRPRFVQCTVTGVS